VKICKVYLRQSGPDTFRVARFTPIQIGPSLEWYACPVCRKQSNLRWTDESRDVYVLGCNAVCAARMLKLNFDRIAKDCERGLGLIRAAFEPDLPAEVQHGL
jgi:hypothetical protein